MQPTIHFSYLRRLSERFFTPTRMASFPRFYHELRQRSLNNELESGNWQTLWNKLLEDLFTNNEVIEDGAKALRIVDFVAFWDELHQRL